MSRPAQNDGYAAQTNQTPDPTLTLTLTPTLWGALGLLSRSAGAVLSLRAILKILHVRTPGEVQWVWSRLLIIHTPLGRR